MFREMRRNKQALTAEEIAEILKRNTSGVLAVNGDGGYPYAVPLSYVYLDSKLYFHCAGVGEKWEILKNDPCVCLTAVTNACLMPAYYDTAYDCAMVKGRAVVVTDETERHAAMRLIVAALAPGHLDRLDEHMARRMDATKIVKIVPEEITGKQNVRK